MFDSDLVNNLLVFYIAQVLDYIHESLLPQAGVLDADRALLKDATRDHAAFRAHSGEGEVTWKARMKPSGILSFELIDELVYNKKYDNGVKQAAKLGGAPEQVFEQEPIKEAWDKIVIELAKESEERKASGPKADADEEETAEEEILQTVRKAPTNFALHSAAYWRAVANQCVRTYVTLIPEPKTTDAVVRAITQSSLKDIAGTPGESCVLTFLDLDCLGESQGPGAQALLRKKFTPDGNLLRKLVHGSMLARGSQKREGGEATRVIDGDIISLHDGFGSASGLKECKALFRLSSSKTTELDSEVKEVLVIFDDDSIRNRKQRVRGSYTSATSLLIASSVALSQCLPEKPYEFHQGHTTSNVINRVAAMAPSDLWHVGRLVLKFVAANVFFSACKLVP